VVPRGCLNFTLLQVLGRTVCKIACINTLFSDHKGALTPSQVELQRQNGTLKQIHTPHHTTEQKEGSSSRDKRARKEGVKTKFEAWLCLDIRTVCMNMS